MEDSIQNLAEIKKEVEQSARLFGLKKPRIPKIIAVSKNFPAETMIPLLESGHRLFGENKVQEAQSKWPGLKAKYEDIELHLIGPLQTNKTKDAMELFDVIESLDREKLAREIAKIRDKTGKCPDLLIQVNTGEEPQKAGVIPAETDALINKCRDIFNLPVKGLMCLPPADQEPSPHFALLKKIAERNGLETLSMGMSKDYTTAAAMGATHVRIGSAIFGERK